MPFTLFEENFQHVHVKTTLICKLEIEQSSYNNTFIKLLCTHKNTA